MTLTSGTRLGPYEILAALGAGGMGEVYRARDTKLNRDVAIKVLPDLFASDADRVARFRREAQVLAALNHPHIAAIYGFEDAGDAPALVLEFVDGPTLADRIALGAIAIDDALPIAHQIAEALEAAHEKGVIHRDLKPANVKLTADGKVKVLDFGLAKMLETEVSSSLSMSPTLSLHATYAGVILGTASYMSPEQARGRPVDTRTDLWAFGCVFYEMLTGRQVFESGETVSDAIAAILSREPDWTALPTGTPESVRRLLRRCLDKDRARRLNSAAAARIEIEDAKAGPGAAALAAPSANASRPPRWVVAAGVAALTALGTVLMWWQPWRKTTTPTPMRFAIVLPKAQALALGTTTGDRLFAISPDGTRLAYIAGGTNAGGGQLMVRPIDRLEAEPLPGITGARAPFFSPDGKWIGFFEGTTEIRKVSVTGGSPIPVCKITGVPRGASWGPDDTIVFATSDPTTGLLSVPAGGGEPTVLTKPDAARGEQDHQFPSVLPDGRAVLFTITPTVGPPLDNSHVAVLDLKTGQRKTLVRGHYADYAGTGHLIYAAAGTLRAVRFDPVRLDVLSDPVPVVEQVATVTFGAAEFSLSRTGSLVYIPGVLSGQETIRSLAWVDRHGREEPIQAAPPRAYYALRLSPDGTRLAIDIRDQDNDIWIWSLPRQSLTPLTFGADLDRLPVWTPDGRHIVFGSTRSGGQGLFRQPADGTGAAEPLTTPSARVQVPTSFSPDGKLVFMDGTGAGAGLDLMLLATDGKAQPTPLVRTMFEETNGEVSPDGRWLAYQSNESRADEIYVRPFPDVNSGKWRVSTAGGSKPVWARNGRELFYVDGNNFLTVVPVQATTTFTAGNATRLFETRTPAALTNGRFYDVSLDGQRFVMIKETPALDQSPNATPANMVVVLNWVEDLKRLVPTK